MKSIIETFVLILALLFVYLFYKKWIERKGKAVKKSDNFDEFENMNVSFLSKSENRETINIARIFSPFDLAIIRSLLSSCDIENYVQYDHVSSLFPGVGIDRLTDITISIFREDYEEAREVIQDYINEKQTERNLSQKLGSKVRNIGEFIVAGRFVSKAYETRDPEIFIL